MATLRMAIDGSGALSGGRAVEGALGRVLSAATSAKRAMLGLSAAIVAYGAASVRAYAKFETQMAMVSTMLSGKDMAWMPKYEKGIKRLSVEFGESTQTLTDGMYKILSATISPAKALDVLAVSAKAATAGMTDTGTAAYAITGIMNAYKMSAEKAVEVSDSLFATVWKGQTTFAELATQMGRVTAISSDVGVSLEQVSAAISTITRGGISTDEAITGLRMALTTLQGKEESGMEIARKYGIELSSAALKAGQLSAMVEKLAKLSPDVRKGIIRNIRARVALNTLIKDQTGFLADLEVQQRKAGFTQTAYEKMAATLAHTLKQVWQAIKLVSVQVGSRFRADIEAISQALLSNMDYIGDWAEKWADRAVFIKDVMMAVIKVFQTDWQNGIQRGLDAAIILFEGFGTSIYLIVEDAFMRINRSIGTWMKRTAAEYIEYERAYATSMYEQKLGFQNTHPGKRQLPGSWAPSIPSQPSAKELAAMEQTARAYAEAQIKILNDQKILEVAYPTPYKVEPLKLKLEALAKDTAKRLADLGVPEETSKGIENAYAKYNAKRAESQLIQDSREADKAIVSIKNSFMEKLVNPAVESVKPLKDAFFSALGYAKETKQVAQETVKVAGGTEAPNEALVKMREMTDALRAEKEILGYVNEERERGRDIIEFTSLAKKANIANVEEEVAAYKAEIKSLREASDLRETANATGDAFGRMFANMAIGAATAGDAIRSLANDILNLTAQRMISEPISQGISNWFYSSASSNKGYVTSSGQTITPKQADTWLKQPFPHAEGGIFTQPHVGMVAEGGRPEGVVDLVKGARGWGVRDYGGGGDSGGGQSGPIINIQNNTSGQAKVSNQDVRWDSQLKRYIINVCLDDYNSNGDMRKTFRGGR